MDLGGLGIWVFLSRADNDFVVIGKSIAFIGIWLIGLMGGMRLIGYKT